MKRLALIILALASIGAGYSSPKGINGAFATMEKSGGIVDASKAFGGLVEVLTGTHYWTQPVYITSGQTIDGKDLASRRIVWMGGPGTAAIVINSYTTNQYVHRPAVRNLQIDCTAGGDCIKIDPSAKWVDSLIVEHVVTTGAILLPNENYHVMLNDVEIRIKDRQALRLDGQVNVLRDVRVNGSVSATAAKIPAVVELHGSAAFDGFCWLEGNFACPTIAFCDWQGWSGEFTVGPTWEEAHVDGTFALVSNATVTTSMIGGTEKWPWQLDRGGTIRTQRQPHSPGTVVSPDGSGKLVVNGAVAAIEAAK